MPDSRRASFAPWITAAVAGVLTAVLALVYFGLLLPYRDDHPAGVFTSAEQDAVAAATTEAANLLTYSRKNFDADFKRALDGATGALRTDIEGKRATTLKAMTTGKFDLTATVTHQALVGPTTKNSAGKGYVVLVTVNGFRSSQPGVPSQQSLAVTVVKSGGAWKLSDVQNVGVS